MDQFEPRFQGEVVVSREYFLVSRKLGILLSDSANCTVLRAVVLTQYRRVTDRRTDRRADGQTDRIAIASTALAMRALRRAVKILHGFASRHSTYAAANSIYDPFRCSNGVVL